MAMAAWTLDQVQKKIAALGFKGKEQGTLEARLYELPGRWDFYFAGNDDDVIRGRIETLLPTAAAAAAHAGGAPLGATGGQAGGGGGTAGVGAGGGTAQQPTTTGTEAVCASGNVIPAWQHQPHQHQQRGATLRHRRVGG
uniref:Uncharacterized protein n=1 Tax=Chlamydomonas leiostraca TaxID=1034604 RepID=A0A7S0RF38_9CHLO|mmetsp:Transcript_20529/g.52102  ORF Transcript_20529/g.52102 Transcript_20529/m.52102 type:complete len:140 (+) Transcript_20529:65-484(+)